MVVIRNAFIERIHKERVKFTKEARIYKLDIVRYFKDEPTGTRYSLTYDPKKDKTVMEYLDEGFSKQSILPVPVDTEPTCGNPSCPIGRDDLRIQKINSFNDRKRRDGAVV